MVLLMTTPELWGLLLGTAVTVAVCLVAFGVWTVSLPRRSARIRDAVGTVNEFAQAHANVAAMNDPNARATATRVLRAAENTMGDLVPEPHQPDHTLGNW